jgi:hypothetical protein
MNYITPITIYLQPKCSYNYQVPLAVSDQHDSLLNSTTKLHIVHCCTSADRHPVCMHNTLHAAHCTIVLPNAIVYSVCVCVLLF